MTATDELHRMLDERGVSWKCYGYENHTWWGEWHAENRASVNGLFLKVEGVVTPAQAIAATLGGGYQGFWTHDGTLHIELPKLPESILVCLPDKRDREVRSARVWRYTLGDADATRERQGVAETCKADETETIKCWVKCKDEPSTEHVELIHVMECSACGGTYEYVNGSYEYCPRCRRRVVE